jgi:hypothetical protein
MFLKIFGRITSPDKLKIQEILESIFDPTSLLACYETADDGCSNFHSHFIGETSNYKTLKSLRQSLSTKCYKSLSLHNQYSIKEYKEDLQAEAYICKGHKKDLKIKPDIFINTLGVDTQTQHEIFHENQKTFKETQNVRNTWKSIKQYIDQKDPLLLHGEYGQKTTLKICSLMYDYYIENDKIVQGKYQQQNILRTIIAHSFKSREVKKSIILDWSSDFTYYSSGEIRENAIFSYDDIL